jgi:hypothetical protein
LVTVRLVYLRFTLLATDPGSNRKQGILVAAHELRDHGALTVAEGRELRQLLEWFNVNLNHPACLGQPGNHRALSWFKPGARKPIAQMWRLVELLRAHDIHVQVHKTRNPGVVLYEDGWQVVAKPSRRMREGW